MSREQAEIETDFDQVGLQIVHRIQVIGSFCLHFYAPLNLRNDLTGSSAEKVHLGRDIRITNDTSIIVPSSYLGDIRGSCDRNDICAKYHVKPCSYHTTLSIFGKYSWIILTQHSCYRISKVGTTFAMTACTSETAPQFHIVLSLTNPTFRLADLYSTAKLYGFGIRIFHPWSTDSEVSEEETWEFIHSGRSAFVVLGFTDEQGREIMDLDTCLGYCRKLGERSMMVK
jgi:hypothetical protein